MAVGRIGRATVDIESVGARDGFDIDQRLLPPTRLLAAFVRVADHAGAAVDQAAARIDEVGIEVGAPLEAETPWTTLKHANNAAVDQEGDA